MSNDEKKMKVRSIIDGVNENQLHTIDIPIRPFIQIAENLFERGSRDSALLQKRKYDITKIELIPELCNQLRESSANFFNVRFEQPKSRVEFLDLREKADEILYECWANFDVAFYGYDDLTSKTSEMRTGGSHADTIQDLIDTKVLAESNRELLEKVAFDFSILDQIPEMASRMANLLAKATADQSESPILRIARDKCYTALRDILDELVRYGRLATKNNSALLSQYNTTYRPVKRATKEKTPQVAATA